VQDQDPLLSGNRTAKMLFDRQNENTPGLCANLNLILLFLYNKNNSS